MSTSYIIEVGETPAGLVISEGRGFRFHSAARDFDQLEDRLFATPGAAAEAARLHRRSPGKTAAPPPIKSASFFPERAIP
jgi:hypothetical protein